MNSLLYSIQVVLADAAADALQPLFLALALKISYQATYHSLRSGFRSSLQRHARHWFVTALAWPVFLRFSGDFYVSNQEHCSLTGA